MRRAVSYLKSIASRRYPMQHHNHLGARSRLLRAGRRLALGGMALGARMAVTRPAPGPPRHILVIKPDHLGDLLLATPALHQLRRQHPQARIVALVGPWSAPILARNPDIDALLTLPFPGFDRRSPDPAQRAPARLCAPYLALLRYAALLRASRFDTALLLRDDHWWGAALALLAGIPRRIGHATPECRPLLTTALPWDPAHHVAAQALAVVQATGDPPGDLQRPPLVYQPAPNDHAQVMDWLAQQGIGPAERLVVIHPGTGGPAKLWPAARWSAVAAALAELPGVRLALTGGPGEEALVAAVAAPLDPPPLILAGVLRLGQLAALLGRAALVLGVDSGPLHIAVSQGAPTIHLFGPGDNARFGPWGDPARHIVVRAGVWCSPCGVFSACPRGIDPPECMALIDAAGVVQQARAMLSDPITQ